MAAAVLYVKDLDRLARFYETCLALSHDDGATGQEPGSCVLTGTGWELALVAVPPSVAPSRPGPTVVAGCSMGSTPRAT